MTPLDEYKLIIEARNFHYSKFHTWSTYFSVIVGALFVAFYGDTHEYRMLIVVLGYLVSMCWYLSNKGYTYWWNHWAKYLMHVEKSENLKTNIKRADGLESNFEGTAGVYTTLFNAKTDGDGITQCENTDYFIIHSGANISTSKVILVMTFLISVAWGSVLLGCLSKEAGLKDNWFCCVIGSIIGTWILSAMFGAILSSDISNHKVGGKNDKNIKREMRKYIICDYGNSSIGKSHVLGMVINYLEMSAKTVRHGDIELMYDGTTGKDTDKYVKYEAAGVRIAICTQGDPDLDQLEKLKDAAQWEADVIVCAARDDCEKARTKVTDKTSFLDYVDCQINEEVKKIFKEIKEDIDTVEKIYIPKFDEYIKIWYRNFFTDHPIPANINSDDFCRKMNLSSAKSIIELIEKLFNISIL